MKTVGDDQNPCRTANHFLSHRNRKAYNYEFVMTMYQFLLKANYCKKKDYEKLTVSLGFKNSYILYNFK